MRDLLRTIAGDLRAKARWCYGDDSRRALVRVLLTDGTLAIVLYRVMQWSRRVGLTPLELVANRLNSIACNCIIGRGAEFGPEFVLVHATGVVINGEVVGGSRVVIEHQVTIGAERRKSPVLGDDVFIGAGAKVIGDVDIGTHARIGANAVVVKSVPAYSTAVGVPARVVRCHREAAIEVAHEDRPSRFILAGDKAPPSFALNSLVLAAQPFLLSVLSVFATAYIIRGLGPVEYGRWATAAALTGATGIFANLGLRPLFIRSLAGCPPSAASCSPASSPCD